MQYTVEELSKQKSSFQARIDDREKEIQKLRSQVNNIIHLKFIYSWTSLCRSGRDPEKYFDIGMVRDNQLVIMGSETFWQIISFKKNAYLQASFYHYLFCWFENIK